MPTPELRIDAPPALAPVAARIRTLAPAAFARIMLMLGISDGGPPVTLHLVTEDTELARGTPHWIAGFARPNESVMVIFPARSVAYPYDSLEDVARHEIAHVLIARAAGYHDVPRWFHEGVALISERAWGVEDRTRAALALTGRRWTTSELEAAFDDVGGRSAAAYAIAGALVRDLVRRRGADTPARILARLASGETFDAAFSSVVGVSVRTNDEQFWRANWWYEVIPFVTSSAVLWFGVTLLGLWAIRTRRARDAERRKVWEAEEAAALAARPPDRSDEVPPTIH